MITLFMKTITHVEAVVAEHVDGDGVPEGATGKDAMQEEEDGGEDALRP